MRTLLNTLERCTENKPEQRDNDAGKVDEAASCVCLGAGPVEEVRVEEWLVDKAGLLVMSLDE